MRPTKLRPGALCLALALLMPALPDGAAAQNPFSPALVVNDDVITHFDLAERSRFYRVFGLDESRAAALAQEALIEEVLKLQEARRLGLTVSPAELEDGIARFARSRNLTADRLIAGLGSRGVGREALEDFIRAELAWRKVVRLRFGSRATPTEQDIESALELGLADENVSVRLAELAMPFEERGEEETLALAAQLVEELRAGGDFTAAVRRYSRSGSAAQGGDIGWAPLDALPPEIATEISLLEIGEVTPPIPITRGVTIIKLLDQRTDVASAADGESEAAAQVTYAIAIVEIPTGASTNERQQFRNEARALALGLGGCGDVVAQGSELSAGSGIIGPVPEAELSDTAASALDGLAIDAASSPVETDTRFEIYVLCSRDAGTGGSPVDARDSVRGEIFEQRLGSFADGYLQELRRDAVTEVR
ncbi:MAG: peptidylprolyl isomerase [Pseudomonadota bacterium]